MPWIKGNRYLNIDEMTNNATIIYDRLSPTWAENAIFGMLGNMQRESTINPGIWQNLTPDPSMGWGLVQWTPSTNYTDWACQNGYATDDGDKQILWIDTLSGSTGQWIPTTGYNISWEQYKRSTESVEYTTTAFLKNFERAGVAALQERIDNALHWQSVLTGRSPVDFRLFALMYIMFFKKRRK